MRSSIVVLTAAGLFGCGEPLDIGTPLAFAPGGPTILSTNSPGQDYDPTVLSARDSTIYVMWVSRRDGNAELYLAHTRGTDWTAPVRITADAADDVEPRLMQDDQGTYKESTAPGRRSVRWLFAPETSCT